MRPPSARAPQGNAVLLDQAVHGGPAAAELLGGARDVPAGLLERAQELVALAGRAARADAVEALREIRADLLHHRASDAASAREGDRALEHLHELRDVAGPALLGEEALRRRREADAAADGRADARDV